MSREIDALVAEKVMTDTKELRKLAEAATAGPWDIVKRGEWEKEFRGSCGRRFMSHRSVREQDTKYVAAANPQAIIALLDRLDAKLEEDSGGCFCGQPMLADTEDWEQPLCPHHYEQYKKHFAALGES